LIGRRIWFEHEHRKPFFSSRSLGGQVVKACLDGSSAASLDPGSDMDMETHSQIKIM
jgi:hypothetical protein